VSATYWCGVARVDGVGEGVQPPAGVGPVDVPQVQPLRVAEPDHLCGVEPAAGFVARGQVQVGGVTDERAGVVVGRHPRGEVEVGDELPLHFGQADQGGMGVARVDLGGTDRLRPALVGGVEPSTQIVRLLVVSRSDR
jgi:hypothetical protein